MSAPLPATLVRWCCEGKSCGNTELYIDPDQAEVGPGESSLPVLYTVRRRSNDDVYGPRLATEAVIRAWIAATAGNVNPVV